MRYPNRIKPFFEELAALWSKYPDLRFGQLMSNVARLAPRDIFYMEEDELIKVIRELLR